MIRIFTDTIILTILHLLVKLAVLLKLFYEGEAGIIDMLGAGKAIHYYGRQLFNSLDLRFVLVLSW